MNDERCCTIKYLEPHKVVKSIYFSQCSTQRKVEREGKDSHTVRRTAVLVHKWYVQPVRRLKLNLVAWRQEGKDSQTVYRTVLCTYAELGKTVLAWLQGNEDSQTMVKPSLRLTQLMYSCKKKNIGTKDPNTSGQTTVASRDSPMRSRSRRLRDRTVEA